MSWQTAGRDLRSELRSQLFARPDEDGPRMVYADWLTEQGELRGAFIHDQVRVASMDAATPGWSSWHAASERTLLKYRREWEEPLRAAYSPKERRRQLDRFVWRRGFVEGVELKLWSLASFAPLSALEPLQSVSVSITGAPTSQELLPIVQLSPSALRLQTPPFAMDRAGLTLGATAFNALRSLFLPNTRSFALSGTRMYPETASALARWLAPTSLRSLSLEESSLDGEGLRRLIAAGTLDGLSHLGLLGHQCGRALEGLCELPGTGPLSLSLRGRPQTDLYAAALLLQQRPLSALSLFGQSDASELEWLLESPRFASVRRLALPGCFSLSNSARVQSLAEVPFEGLTHLDLSLSLFEPGAFRTLLGSPHLQKLVSLDLHGTGLGDEGIEALVSSDLTGLVALDLSEFALTDRGAELLASWPGLAHVTQLLLDGNAALKSDGLCALMRSPYLDLTRLGCAVPALQRAGRRSRPLRDAVMERFGRALR